MVSGRVCREGVGDEAGARVGGGRIRARAGGGARRRHGGCRHGRAHGAQPPLLEATQSATVTSTAGDATLSVADPSPVATGHLVNGAFSLPEPLQAAGRPLPAAVKTWAAPVSNDPVTVEFSQLIKSTDALRTGTYAKSVTFTLSTPNQ